MQLSDTISNTDAIEEACDETRFQQYIEKIDALPLWKKKELEEEMRRYEFTLSDIVRIMEGGDDWPPTIDGYEHGEMQRNCGDGAR